ncbi:hypothetical protein P875_00053079 [Aspergillus parasiticus SU-1]|uniref:Uncharacterized protein n=1 Tax=Aspergillus parasiticus (strain ATCC 56775 / NRRL 5862 / SRRC 143 / SU-1) TaxID=1403190 RepID=A0A0F0HYY2_ASPPU|nr:hypothetical protein P875_00053079 [Aspergillus parasiticus SU-1]
MALEMNTTSKSPSTSPSSMRVNTPSSDESTSPPWHAWELVAPTSADEPWGQDQPDAGTSFPPLVNNSMSDAPEPEGAILNFAGTSELAQIYKEYNSHGYGQLVKFVLLVEALPSGQYVFQMYGLEGLNLLDKLIAALQSSEFPYELGVIQIIATEDSIEVLYQEEIPWVHSMMMWFCSAFREPIPGSISPSYGTPTNTGVLKLNPLEPLPVTSSIYQCCSTLFGCAVIAASPGADTTGHILLGMDISVVEKFIRNEYILVSPSGLAVAGRLVFFLEGKPCEGHVIECQISVPECVQVTRVLLKFCPFCLNGVVEKRVMTIVFFRD